MFNEDELLPLSALQHLLFCERQCALIHIEQAWAENRFTAEGRILHERVDEAGRESRGRIRTVSGLPLRSLRLGLSGKADAVEFHREGDDDPSEASVWRPFPVEYKRGKPKQNDCDLVQLCAQALCLEEMLGVVVSEGAIYYGKPRRRLVVVLDEVLREKTREGARRLHELINSGRTPQARYEKKCESCSMLSICMPKVTGSHRSVQGYMAKVFAQEI
ncbi:MAG: CRISPR-associated protein Cas4 [Proteobacteria bacterium]|jgi:CRISPR-associated exonuclease Cas4|nr:CRISPR-associated protein Cas4 [Desulfocapsa sp.]MBU3946116.1 CRISPR-associated protein Cas4 [Pseudomonadota bacterium]MCG2742351.1 CRISPR-associated protein Cas4 [Desulfobacteraceae bacterium]MDP3186719.1 CRISPR-associated protein Cas4 [Anaerolineales bacterium]MBU3982366.1 CRISPR-associated protein Cas4 [Pseudomonadota bacterium]